MLRRLSFRVIHGQLPGVSSARAVSSKYPRPKPRPYRRRWFEAALQPILPSSTKVCISPDIVREQRLAHLEEYSDVELALAKHVKVWMKDQDFRVMAICQFLPVPGRTLWLSKNQLRLKDVELRNYGNKVMERVFEGTPLSSLCVSLVGSNAMLFGKTLDSVRTIVTETDKLNWIVPLVFVMDGRVVSCEQARELGALMDLQQIRAETAAIIDTQIRLLPSNLDMVTAGLPTVLDCLQKDRERKSPLEALN